MNRTLGETPPLDDMTEEEALAALSSFLEPRIAQAKRGEVSTKSFEEIRKAARDRAGV